jgi:hypothetical protein
MTSIKNIWECRYNAHFYGSGIFNTYGKTIGSEVFTVTHQKRDKIFLEKQENSLPQAAAFPILLYSGFLILPQDMR